jgi:hypothetical protein
MCRQKIIFGFHGTIEVPFTDIYKARIDVVATPEGSTVLICDSCSNTKYLSTKNVSSACLYWICAGLVVGLHPLANNHRDGQESSSGSFLQRGKDLWKQIVNLFVNCLQQLSVQDFQVPDGSVDTSRRSSEVFSAGDLIYCNDRYSGSRKLTSLL